MHLNTADRVLNWIAGLAVVVFAIILFTGENSNKNDANNVPSATMGSMNAPMKAPSSTTGSAPKRSSPEK
jgi:hypothetical protein